MSFSRKLYSMNNSSYMFTGNLLPKAFKSRKNKNLWRRSNLRSKNLKQIEIPQTYEEILNEAEIVGIMLGDGHIKNHGSIRLRVRELDFCHHFSRLIERTYGIEAPLDDKYYYNCHAHSTLLAERITKLTKNNTQIPEFIIKGDKKIKARFIRGFSDAEGSMDTIYNRRQIVITQANAALLEQIKYFLLDLDIQSRVLRKKFDSARLIISLLENLEKYQEHIGFVIGYKRKKLAEAIKYLRNCKAHDKQKWSEPLFGTIS